VFIRDCDNSGGITMTGINKNDVDWLISKACDHCKHNLLIRVDEKKCIRCRAGMPITSHNYNGFTIVEEEDQKDWWQRFKNMDEQNEFDAKRDVAAPRDAFDKLGEIKPEYVKEVGRIVEEEQTS